MVLWLLVPVGDQLTRFGTYENLSGLLSIGWIRIRIFFPVLLFGDVMNLIECTRYKTVVALRLFLTIKFGLTTGSFSDGERGIPFMRKSKSWMRIRDDPNLSAKGGEI